MRLTLEQTVARRAAEYIRHEAVLRDALEAMGCEVTSNMTSLVVLNLPGDMAGREMELVQHCRAQNFGIWPTLSTPVQIRIGILNQLKRRAIEEIATRFAQAIRDLGGTANQADINDVLHRHYGVACAAE